MYVIVFFSSCLIMSKIVVLFRCW